MCVIERIANEEQDSKKTPVCSCSGSCDDEFIAVDYSCVMEVRAEESAEEQNLTVEETVEIDPEILEQLPDNDELFAGHVEQVLYGNDDASIYANYGEDKFEDLNLSIYRQLKALVNKIANEGGTAVVAIPDNLDITWETEATGDTLKEEAKAAFAK